MYQANSPLGDEVFTIDGELDLTIQKSTVSLILGSASDPDDPGIVIDGSELVSLNAYISAGSALPPFLGLSVSTPDGLTFEYDRTSGDFEMYGDLQAQFATAGGQTTYVGLSLGTESQPGLEIENGNLESVVAGIDGQFNVWGLEFSSPISNPALVTYSEQNAEWTISGTVSVLFADQFQVSVTLGTQSAPGIVIENGQFALNNLKLQMDNLNLGLFSLQQLYVDYADENGTYTFSVSADVVLPTGTSIAGTFVFDGYKLDDIALSYSSSTGISLGDTGLFINALSGSIQNIDDPANLIFSGSMTVTYGTELSLLGKKASLLAATGSFTVSSSELDLSGSVYVGAYYSGNNSWQGLLGEGTGTIDLDWGSHTYTAQIQISMLEDTIQINAGFEFTGTAQDYTIEINADAQVQIPSFVPFIGGSTLGSVNLVFRLHQL